MRSTQLFFLAAAAGIAHAQTTTTSSSSSDSGLSPASSSYLAAESSIVEKLDKFETVPGVSAFQSDVVSWQQVWLSTQTALPTDTPQDEETNYELENAFEASYVQGMLDLMEKKDYLKDKAEQSSLVEVIKEYQTLLSGAAGTYVSQPTETGKSAETSAAAGTDKEGEDEETKDEENKDEDNAAGRVGGVGALAAVLVSGLLVVVAL